MMHARRTTLLAVALGLAVIAPPASAKGGLRATINPAKPIATDALAVTFALPRKIIAGDQFQVVVSVPQNAACAGSALVQIARRDVRAGKAATISVAPNRFGRYAGWCAGEATAKLLRGRELDPEFVVIATKRFTIARADGFNPGELGTLALIDVLSPSTATVTAPGRPLRVLGLGGTLDGFIPGKFQLNSDYGITIGPRPTTDALPGGSDGLVVRSLVTDPLCAAPVIQTLAPIAEAPAVSKLSFGRDGTVAGALVFAADPTTFAGCAGPAGGSTTVQFSGTLGIKKLAELTLRATIPGVDVGGGVTGSVELELHLKVNILDS